MTRTGLAVLLAHCACIQHAPLVRFTPASLRVTCEGSRAPVEGEDPVRIMSIIPRPFAPLEERAFCKHMRAGSILFRSESDLLLYGTSSDREAAIVTNFARAPRTGIEPRNYRDLEVMCEGRRVGDATQADRGLALRRRPVTLNISGYCSGGLSRGSFLLRFDDEFIFFGELSDLERWDEYVSADGGLLWPSSRDAGFRNNSLCQRPPTLEADVSVSTDLPSSWSRERVIAELCGRLSPKGEIVLGSNGRLRVYGSQEDVFLVLDTLGTPRLRLE